MYMAYHKRDKDHIYNALIIVLEKYCKKVVETMKND